ncbi:hypothetical protein Vretimale_4072 [Volvox reticuliferus]|nr:hypothetical protein Vretimale_4072 [Volvox reticuliferus]
MPPVEGTAAAWDQEVATALPEEVIAALWVELRHARQLTTAPELHQTASQEDSSEDSMDPGEKVWVAAPLPNPMGCAGKPKRCRQRGNNDKLEAGGRRKKQHRESGGRARGRGASTGRWGMRRALSNCRRTSRDGSGNASKSSPSNLKYAPFGALKTLKTLIGALPYFAYGNPKLESEAWS